MPSTKFKLLLTVKKGPRLLRFVQKLVPTYFMYFSAFQRVLIKGLRFVVRPCFFYNTKILSKTDILHRVKSSERYRIFRGPTKRFSKRPYLLRVSYVSLHGSSFSFLGSLLSRVVVFGSSLFFRYPRRFTLVTISTLLVLHILQSLGEKGLLLPLPGFQDSICQFRIVSNY